MGSNFLDAELEDDLDKLSGKANEDEEQFLRFAYGFVDDMGSRFLEVSPENRLRCKEVVFLAGFYVDDNKRVYTPEKSYLITLAAKKKDAEASSETQLVQHC